MRFTGPVVALATVGLVAGLGIAQASGKFSYARTAGASMLPSYRAGDLVVVAGSPRYQVGEVVAYPSRVAGDVVLHRIVGGDDAGYITKGDNNPSVDVERPRAGQLIGRVVLRVPGVGAVLASNALRALVALIALVALGSVVLPRRTPLPRSRSILVVNADDRIPVAAVQRL